MSPNREFIGIMPTQKALLLAQNAGVDLVEIVPQASPPVCQIIEYSKFLYEEKKREEAHHKSQPKVKEVYLTPRIAEHDLQTKINHAVEFLKHRDSVKIIVEFSGREMQHQDLGYSVLNRFLAGVSELGKSVQRPKLAGRKIFAMVQPIASA